MESGTLASYVRCTVQLTSQERNKRPRKVIQAAWRCHNHAQDGPNYILLGDWASSCRTRQVLSEECPELRYPLAWRID